MSTDAVATVRPGAPLSEARARALRRAGLGGSFLGSAVAGMAVALLIAVGASFALGYRTFAVLSGSMEPAVHTGDVVVDEQIAPLAARVGDVVTFKDPARSGQLVTHRLRSVRRHGAVVEMVTKGDANNAVERWRGPVDGTIGRVVFRAPAAGRAIAAIRGRYGQLLLIALPALLLGMYELARIWRPRRAP